MIVGVAIWAAPFGVVNHADRPVAREKRIMVERRNDTDGTARKTVKQAKAGEVDNAEFRGYINVNLTDAQKEKYPAWAVSAAYWEALEGFTAAGVNLSLKRERGTNGFLASATQRDPGSVNAGLCVTARGRDPATALGRLLFTLTILSKKDRWEDTQPLSNPDRW